MLLPLPVSAERGALAGVRGRPVAVVIRPEPGRLAGTLLRRKVFHHFDALVHDVRCSNGRADSAITQILDIPGSRKTPFTQLRHLSPVRDILSCRSRSLAFVIPGICVRYAVCY